VDDAASIREAARVLDERLEAGDTDGVVACFASDCAVELLGVRLSGHDGVRRWLAWIRRHVTSIRFEPVVIGVEGTALFEEFVVHARLRDGSPVTSRWAEVLDYRDGLVTGLRLYFDPLDFAAALGRAGRWARPIVTRLARRGLAPFEVA
jgi:ketosteroid isomerase-like protein